MTFQQRISILLLVLAGCDGGGSAAYDPDAPFAPGRPDADVGAPGDGAVPGADAVTVGPDARPADTRTAATLYAALCAHCHGPAGEGGAGPTLRRAWDDREALVRRIDETMPLGDPGACDRDCAETLADHLRARPWDAPPDCARFTPRRLRLLTRREYARTVRDLLPACGERTFRLDAPGARTVHVAGTFNGWAPTVDAGGWAMAASGDTWTLTRRLDPGRHLYKFVVDERDWRTDPGNPETETDAQGNVNSVVEVACEAPGDPTAGFPPETRPEGFPFDDHAGANAVTSVHVAEQLAAAERLAAAFPDCDGACAEAFARDFGRRAFRRPLTEAEVARYAPLGARTAARAMLASPHFLYRTELGTPAGDAYRLTGHETAAALSYFLWGTTPDAALDAAADAGRLDTAAGVEAEARRMLDDPRARETLGAFALQWLGVESLPTVTRDAALSDALRQDMLEETRRFVTHVAFDGGGTGELFTADYTFASPALAAYYGLAAGDPTALDARRAGLLGHGSVLATYAHSDQTSPIRRGLFVRRALLCQPLPPPPPDAGGVPDVDPGATTRERFAQHTASPFCHSCHRYIDDVGFGFERFDAVGRWRETENGLPIDGLGDMNDLEGLGTGTRAPYRSLPELGALLAESRAARRCFVTQVFRFALGRMETPDDACALDALDARLAETDDVRALLVAVAASPAFLMRAAEEEAP